MARKKSLGAQLLKAYQDAKKAKAVELKRQQQEEARRARAAEQERLQRERAAEKQEREQAQQWSAAQQEKQRQDAERKRKAEQVEKDLAKRQAARQRAAEQQQREQERQAQQAARQAKQDYLEQLKAEAHRRTDETQARQDALTRVLLDRPARLLEWRDQVEQAITEDTAAFITAVEEALLQRDYPPGLRKTWRLAYAPETCELMLDVDLPGQDVIPAAAGYRYKASDPPAVVPQPRKEAEMKELYKHLVARLALRAVDEVLAVTPPSLVSSVAFNGHVQAKDRATGRGIRPCLVSVRTQREPFEELVLDEPELDPVRCLRGLNAIVSQHPYDLDPVRPVVTFDLSKYKFVEEIDVVAGLDSRPDLVALDPTEFEHLIRRLFEEIGLKSWVTQASRDDGIDAVATNEDPIIGGMCIIQAKRYKNVVPAEAVRALAGVMHDKAAAKGIGPGLPASTGGLPASAAQTRGPTGAPLLGRGLGLLNLRAAATSVSPGRRSRTRTRAAPGLCSSRRPLRKPVYGQRMDSCNLAIVDEAHGTAGDRGGPVLRPTTARALLIRLGGGSLRGRLGQ